MAQEIKESINCVPQNVPQNVPQKPRHKALLKLIEADGSISTDDMAKQLDVSVKTIKRDLKALGIVWDGAAKAGCLRKE